MIVDNGNMNDFPIPICTKLRELYGIEKKEYIEEQIEPIYESMRIKFKIIYNQEPLFFLRVPYTMTILGDNITELFDEQIVTNLDKDLIVCWSLSDNDTKLKFQFHDKFCEQIEHEIGSELNNCNNFDIAAFLIQGYLSGINIVKPKFIKGANFLVSYNIPNLLADEYNMTAFVSTFLSSAYIHESKFNLNKKNFYELCLSEINRIGNFQRDSLKIYHKLFVESNYIGIQMGNEFKNIKIDSNNRMLIFDSFSSQAPLMFSAINFWSKRKVEFRLAIALILKRYRKEISNEEIIEISKSFKTFLKYFENNIETIFGLIEYVKYNLEFI